MVSSRYLKSGKRGKTKRRNFTKYIATRESVEKRPQNTGKTTANQKQLIAELIKEFPMAKQYLEYTDYTKNPSSENASELISTIIERHADIIGNRRNFVGYMANRPGAERRGEHGLFNGSDEPIDLNAVANEVAEHPGYVWTHVVSLRREDAVRLGYTNSDMWRELVKRHIDDISKAQNIPLANMKWYAAFHDTTHHPHIHLIVYSSDPRQGYLTKEGMAAIRSAFANDIFHEDMKSIYQEQTLTRDELKALSEDQMSEILSQIGSGVVDERLVTKVRELNAQLQSIGGKKMYGYLPKEIKQTVDDIFFLLSQNEDIQKLYDKWCEFEKAKYKMYTQKDKELPRLAENKEFRSVKNMIIRKVVNMIEIPDSEPEDIHDDIEEDTDVSFADDYEYVDTEESGSNYYFKWSDGYKSASRILKSQNLTDDEKAEALAVMKSEADKGNVLAIYDMGRYSVDDETAKRYFATALAGFIDIAPKAKKISSYFQYRIGKMYLYGCGTEKASDIAFKWLEKSAVADNKYAQYMLGKMYFNGEYIPADYDKAEKYLSAAASANNRHAIYQLAKLYLTQEKYDVIKAVKLFESIADDNSWASYWLGKIYLFGKDGIASDREKALEWLTKSASDGNEYAEKLINYDNGHNYMISNTIVSLLVDFGRIIEEDNARSRRRISRTDKKLRHLIQQKKQELGIKEDGSQQYEYNIDNSM
ncbi:MobP3 family relaxase [Ruminococcus flavefaciens]|uniref:MobP3 family relaxase n=1 Tax=Ruminococcus flavefaciens TaxID=1265 RepID=UPI001FA76CD7|nr:MobP3 family relaxase [Ruminococcus flavefaciens]